MKSHVFNYRNILISSRPSINFIHRYFTNIVDNNEIKILFKWLYLKNDRKIETRILQQRM